MPTTERPLLMIPGPVEVSPRVLAAAAGAPLGHLDPALVAVFGEALAALRAIWRAEDDAAPFVVAGGGTLAMESAAVNLIAPGDRALVVVTGYFGERMAEMLRRRGAAVKELDAPPGDAPAPAAAERLLDAAGRKGAPFKALFVTHVDTSTGVRLDPEPWARLARAHDCLSVFDGVCAAGGERFEMAAWDADVYFTASQKALGLPPGLALWVASPRALATRGALAAPPPLTLDWQAWRPVMAAYEERRAAYFSTPATTLVAALGAGLAELLEEGRDGAAAMAAVWSRHERAARALRGAWHALGLEPVPVRPELEAHTLSALRFPTGHDNELLATIRARGVAVAGGLHRALGATYFRVGHMGHVTRDREPLLRTVRAIGGAFASDRERAAAERAFNEVWQHDYGTEGGDRQAATPGIRSLT